MGALKQAQVQSIAAHSGWLVTFADLLTLLLCAFLMVFSLTSNKTASHGITIADSTTRGQELSSLKVPKPVRLFEEDLTVGQTMVRNTVFEKLRNAVTTGTYMVAVSYCGEEGIGRGQSLLSQLIDMGVPASRTTLRLAGPHCDYLTKEGSAVAIVSFRHG